MDSCLWPFKGESSGRRFESCRGYHLELFYVQPVFSKNVFNRFYVTIMPLFSVIYLHSEFAASILKCFCYPFCRYCVFFFGRQLTDGPIQITQ